MSNHPVIGSVDRLNKLSLSRVDLIGDNELRPEAGSLLESFNGGGIDKLHSINDLRFGFVFSQSLNSVTFLI